MRNRISLATALIALVALVAASAAVAGKPSSGGGGSTSSDSIWVIGTGTVQAATAGSSVLAYGSSFRAGYSSKASAPWGHLVCTANGTTQLGYATSGAILDSYRAVQADGTIGVFNLNDPLNQLWVGGGADCTLTLVAFQGSGMKTLATTGFTATS